MIIYMIPAFIWVVARPANTVGKRRVTVGEPAGGLVTIVDGVSAGDMVVTAGVSFLRENMSVRPIVNVGE